MLIGQGLSGKTSLKRSLKGERFNPGETSTKGIEMDPSYCKVSQEVWKVGEGTQGTNSDRVPISYEQRTAQYILSHLKKEQEEASSSHEKYENAIVDESGRPSTADYKEHSDLTAVSPSFTPEVSHGTHRSMADVQNLPELPKVPEEIAGLIEKLLQVDGNEKDDEDIYSILWDFGGQAVYYATHPLFLTVRAIYCLVYNLSRNPDGKVSPELMHGFYDDIEENFCEKSNMNYLDFWMSSVSSLVSHDEEPQETSTSELLPERLPPVFLVCTHADKPYESSDPEKLARRMFGSLQTKNYGKHLLDFFVVDNTKSGSGEECQGVAKLRKEVLNVAKELPQMKEVIPIKWLKYEKAVSAMVERGHKWISLDEAKKTAVEECEISNDEQFETMLNFLHDLRILIHFDDTPQLNKMVILDLQWLIDVFKKVITITPFERKEAKFVQAWLTLERTGVLEEKLLQHVWGSLFDNQDTCNSLIAMMEKFCLLCPWPSSCDGESSSKYLVPSMLRYPPQQDVTKLIASAGMPSLYVKFRSGQVPPGLFPRLVLMVFQWCTNEWLCKSPPQLHKNFARFFTHPAEGCSLILLCHSCSIEVVVHKEISTVIPPGMKLSSEYDFDTFQVNVARTVCRELGFFLRCMREQFAWLKNMAYDMSVCCPVCSGKDGSVRYCRIHHVLGCKQEECVHFWSESELRDSQGPITCFKSLVAGDYRVPVELVGLWFELVDQQVNLKKIYFAFLHWCFSKMMLLNEFDAVLFHKCEINFKMRNC